MIAACTISTWLPVTDYLVALRGRGDDCSGHARAADAQRNAGANLRYSDGYSAASGGSAPVSFCLLMEKTPFITRRRLLAAMARRPCWQMRGAQAASFDPQRIVALEYCRQNSCWRLA